MSAICIVSNPLTVEEVTMLNNNKKEDFFTTFEMKCVDCLNWKIHQVLSSTTKFELTNHATCICDLKNFNTTCCAEGLAYTLKINPSLVEEIEVPQLSTMDMLLKKLGNVGVFYDVNDGPNFFFLKCQEIIKNAAKNDK